MKDLEQYLTNRLKEPLPGFAAQSKMGPSRADGSFTHQIQPPKGCRTNAVMVLLYPDDGTHHLVLTIRSSKMPSHAGEISCPGGGVNQGEAPVEAALRETREEVGVPENDIRVAGRLSRLYIPVTNNIIYPHVGFVSEKPELHPDPREVSGILTPALSDILSDKHRRQELWQLGDNELYVPFWSLFDIPLWGATAMILSEFVEIVKQKPQ